MWKSDWGIPFSPDKHPYTDWFSVVIRLSTKLLAVFWSFTTVPQCENPLQVEVLLTFFYLKSQCVEWPITKNGHSCQPLHNMLLECWSWPKYSWITEVTVAHSKDDVAFKGHHFSADSHNMTQLCRETHRYRHTYTPFCMERDMSHNYL